MPPLHHGDGEVAGTELSERMLVALLTIASSNNEADGGVAVGVDIQLVTFLARSFRINGSGIDYFGGSAATSEKSFFNSSIASLYFCIFSADSDLSKSTKSLSVTLSFAFVVSISI